MFIDYLNLYCFIRSKIRDVRFDKYFVKIELLNNYSRVAY